MSKFDFDAYEKVFPKQEEPANIDTAVEGFNPTATINKATDNKPGDNTLSAVDPEPINPEESTPPINAGEETPKGE